MVGKEKNEGELEEKGDFEEKEELEEKGDLILFVMFPNVDWLVSCIMEAAASTMHVITMRSASVNWYKVRLVQPVKLKFHAQLGVSNPSCNNIVFGD